MFTVKHSSHFILGHAVYSVFLYFVNFSNFADQ